MNIRKWSKPIPHREIERILFNGLTMRVDKSQTIASDRFEVVMSPVYAKWCDHVASHSPLAITYHDGGNTAFTCANIISKNENSDGYWTVTIEVLLSTGQIL